jgi:hypothetical protein
VAHALELDPSRKPTANGHRAARTAVMSGFPGLLSRALLGFVVVAICLVALQGCASKSRAKSASARISDSAPASGTLRLKVDHAWVKNAESASRQSAQRDAMENLRTKVSSGASFLKSWKALGVDGKNWHVAEGEVYPYAVVHEDARDLPEGSVSDILPGEGGLHLFRIVAREPR